MYINGTGRMRSTIPVGEQPPFSTSIKATYAGTVGLIIDQIGRSDIPSQTMSPSTQHNVDSTRVWFSEYVKFFHGTTMLILRFACSHGKQPGAWKSPFGGCPCLWRPSCRDGPQTRSPLCTVTTVPGDPTPRRAPRRHERRADFGGVPGHEGALRPPRCGREQRWVRHPGRDRRDTGGRGEEDNRNAILGSRSRHERGWSTFTVTPHGTHTQLTWVVGRPSRCCAI